MGGIVSTGGSGSQFQHFAQNPTFFDLFSQRMQFGMGLQRLSGS